MSSPFIVFSFCLSPTQCRLKTLSGLFKLVESEVEAANVVEDLWSHFGLHLVLEDPGGCLVTLEALSEVILLQDLSQLYPSLNILRKLLVTFFKWFSAIFLFSSLLELAYRDPRIFIVSQFPGCALRTFLKHWLAFSVSPLYTYI